VKLVKAGSREAFAVIYTRYKDSIYHYCLRLLKSEELAKDGVQETFLRMHQNLAGLKDEAAFRAWLFGIARNFVLNSFRSPPMNDSMDPDSLPGEETPHDILIKAEQSTHLQSLIDDLRPIFREVVLLREFEGLSYAEIAEVTGDSESAIKSRLFKARKALASMLVPRRREETNELR
jgi:RNA polymerase sigma-70 factor (ECF subfamily)